ncbi:hypothetical protein, partial [Streptomyces massasporeus]|uniref:hypothetical protein n=1 Tax=Streptomyces massasporeus TaxID=67324 RepID=UPI00331C990B
MALISTSRSTKFASRRSISPPPGVGRVEQHLVVGARLADEVGGGPCHPARADERELHCHGADH